MDFRLIRDRDTDCGDIVVLAVMEEAMMWLITVRTISVLVPASLDPSVALALVMCPGQTDRAALVSFQKVSLGCDGQLFPLGTVIETARWDYLLVLANLSNVTLSSTFWTRFPLSPFLLDVRICGSNKTHCPTIGSTCLLTTFTTMLLPAGFTLRLAG